MPLIMYRLILTLLILSIVAYGCTNSINHMKAEDFFEGQYLTMAKAISRNDINQMKESAVGIDLNKFGKDNMSLLAWGMVEDRPKAVEALIQLGADVNLRDSKGIQPIYDAVVMEDNNKFLKLLLLHGADPNGGTYTIPALHGAYNRNHWQNVIILLDHNADINIRGWDGFTIANASAALNQFDRTAYLLERGADPEATNDGGGTIAMEVQDNVISDSYQLEQQKKVKQMLLAWGVHFPAIQPYEQKYQPLRKRWYETPEGRQWQLRLQAIANDASGFGERWVTEDKAAQTAFKAWMKTNNIPEP